MVDGCCCLRSAPCESFTVVSGSVRRGQQLADHGQDVLDEELLSTVSVGVHSLQVHAKRFHAGAKEGRRLPEILRRLHDELLTRRAHRWPIRCGRGSDGGCLCDQKTAATCCQAQSGSESSGQVPSCLVAHLSRACGVVRAVDVRVPLVAPTGALLQALLRGGRPLVFSRTQSAPPG